MKLWPRENNNYIIFTSQSELYIVHYILTSTVWTNLKTDTPSLIADIGGTNARFALVNSPEALPYDPKTLPCAEFSTLADAAEAYLNLVAGPRPQTAVFSIATPVTGDQLHMTNHVWTSSIQKTRESLGLTSLRIINDYTALALSLPHLTDDDYQQVGGEQSPQGQIMAVLGPGTGLGVSGVIQVGKHWAPLQGEGGHVSYGPLDKHEAGIIDIIREKYDHVSAERLVSGPGLLLLYQSISEFHCSRAQALEPKEITAMAIEKKSPAAVEAVAMFCAILGTLAGNLALTLGARAGIFIGGGIIPQLGEYFHNSSFRSRFEKHGRFKQYLEKIPTYVIRSKYPTLCGAAVALGPDYVNLGFTSDESIDD